MKVLVTGSAGQLGRDVVAVLERDESIEPFAADALVDDPVAIASSVDAVGPDVVIHCAAMTDVDRCERDPERARAVNATGTQNVARAAAAAGAHLVYVSTDYVFDGRSWRPYTETDEPNPISVYGATKLAGERACPPEATVVRTSWLSGVHGANFVTAILRLADSPGELRIVDDQRGSPTCTADLADALVALARDRRPGCFHVTNAGDASRYELAREVVARSGGDPGRVRPIATAELDPPRPAARPAYSVLDNSTFVAAGYKALPDWRDGLARLLVALERR